MWDRQIPAFADRLPVRPRRPPRPRRQPAGRRPAVDRGIADDVLAALDRFGVDRAHFVGLSLGAMVAMSHRRTITRTESIAWRCCARLPTSIAGAVDASGPRRCGLAAWRDRRDGRRSMAHARRTPRPIPTRSRVRGDDRRAPTPRATRDAAKRSGRWTSATGAAGDRAAHARHRRHARPGDAAAPRRDDRQPASTEPGCELVEAAHLANWEQPNASTTSCRPPRQEA